MGIRVQRRISLGKFLRLNVSKSGLSLSGKAGPLTLNSRGGKSAHIMKGVSYRTYAKAGSKKPAQVTSDTPAPQHSTTPPSGNGPKDAKPEDKNDFKIGCIALLVILVLIVWGISSCGHSPKKSTATNKPVASSVKKSTTPTKTAAPKPAPAPAQPAPAPAPSPTPAPQDTAPDPATSQRTVYVASHGTSNVYWYSESAMPSTTKLQNVVTMTEAEAVAKGKHLDVNGE